VSFHLAAASAQVLQRGSTPFSPPKIFVLPTSAPAYAPALQGRRRGPFFVGAPQRWPFTRPLCRHVRQGSSGGPWRRAVRLAVPPASWHDVRALRAVGELAGMYRLPGWHVLPGWSDGHAGEKRVLGGLALRQLGRVCVQLRAELWTRRPSLPPPSCKSMRTESPEIHANRVYTRAHTLLQWRWTTGNSCTVPGSPAWLATGNLPTCGVWGAYPEGEWASGMLAGWLAVWHDSARRLLGHALACASARSHAPCKATWFACCSSLSACPLSHAPLQSLSTVPTSAL